MLAVKATISFGRSFVQTNTDFHANFLLDTGPGDWRRNSLGRAESNKEDFPTPTTLMEAPPSPNASACARLQRGRGRWEAGDVRYRAKSVGETEKQVRYRASIFFPNEL